MKNIGGYNYVYPRYFRVHVMANELRARCVKAADDVHVEMMSSEWKRKM